MAIHGDLRTMDLCDLLQWASLNEKTGVLEIEHHKICRRIEFRKGWIGACSSDDPPSLLGQFLLSRGHIDEDCLREALSRQEVSGENLGVILVRMGVLTRSDLSKQVTKKAEETIYGLFDWDDAVFRFHDGATLDPDQMEVNVSVKEILFKGIQRQDELKRIRSLFPSAGIVLRRTSLAPPGKLLDRAVAGRIYRSIDGERTLAEVLLHAHASEFLVLKLIFRLHQLGLVEIDGERPVSPETTTLLDPRKRTRWNTDDTPEIDEARPAVGAPEPSADREEIIAELDAEIDVARRLVERGEFGAALELLNASYRANPSQPGLRRMIGRAESSYAELLRSHRLGPDRVPYRLECADNAVLEVLDPEARFLLSTIDGVTNIKSILWLVPMREIDALETLQRLIDRGLIGLDGLDSRSAGEEAGEAARGTPTPP